MEMLWEIPEDLFREDREGIMADKLMKELLDAAVAVANEISTIALGYDESKVTAHPDKMPEGLMGSYIALIGEETAIEIGLVSDNEGCCSLARALLGMDADDEDLPEEDIADALGELVNMLAGGIKKRIGEKDASMRIGLPMMVQGKVELPEGTEKGIAEVLLGPVDTLVCMYRNARSGS